MQSHFGGQTGTTLAVQLWTHPLAQRELVVAVRGKSHPLEHGRVDASRGQTSGGKEGGGGEGRGGWRGETKRSEEGMGKEGRGWIRRGE